MEYLQKEVQEKVKSEDRTEQRSVIKFCVGAGMTPTETWKFISKLEKARKGSRSILFDWHKRFSDGRVLYMMTKDLEDLVLSMKPFVKMPALLFPSICEEVLVSAIFRETVVFSAAF